MTNPFSSSQVIEFDRNPNALRDQILVDHSWALGEDGALAVPMDRLADHILMILTNLIMSTLNTRMLMPTLLGLVLG